ncbi:hypothetical protein QBC43DRAFT_212554 [Cladorrhinum sp. PSN259]|nr:hypothetical protein QBC43DRAFT_212554 [Cladorrhinum sp. PSN259]
MDAATSQPGARKRSPSEDEPSSPEGSSLSRKRARVGEGAASADEADERDEGEISDSKDEGSEKAVVSHSGWNGGVNSGLRTSFPSLKKPLRQLTLHEIFNKVAPKPEHESKSEPKPELEVQGKPKEEDEVDEQLKPNDEKLVMPEGYPNYTKMKRARSWESRFEGFCIKLMSLNKNHDRIQDATFLKAAWTGWLKQRKHINPLSLTAGLQACEKIELNAEKLKEMLSRALSSEPNSPADSTSTAEPAAAVNVENSKTGSKSGAKKADSADMDPLILPPAPPSDQTENIKPYEEQAWQDLFLNWCGDLEQLNPTKVKVATSRERNRLADEYCRWVGTIGLLKKSTAAARRTAGAYVQHKGHLLAQIFDAQSQQQQQPQHQDAQSEENHNAVTMNPDAPMEDAQDKQLPPVAHSEYELQCRDRWFPGLAPDATFCVFCATTQHNTADCPEVQCRFCGEDHPAWMCPTRVRCTKCNGMGHEPKGCREKLKMAEEEMECKICASKGHLEDTCPELVRNFQPNMGKPHKVQAVPMYCYNCGKQGHYGGDCGLAPSEQKEKNPWTLENAMQYVDPSSTEIAIAYRAEPPKPMGRTVDGRPDLGKSIVPRQHIHFESDDDDDDDEFIQPAVQKKAKVAGNGTFKMGNFGQRDDNSNGYRNDTSGNSRPGPPLPHGLPPKPPPPSYPSGPAPPPSLGYQAPEPPRHSTRNRHSGGGHGGGGGRGRHGGGGGSNRGRGGFSNRN